MYKVQGRYGARCCSSAELAFHQIYAAVSKKNATVGLERMAEDQGMRNCGEWGRGGSQRGVERGTVLEFDSS